MSATHSVAARNAATDAVTALIGASGKLKFRTAGTIGSPGTAAATLSLSATAFAASGTPTAGTAAANAITSDTNATGNASPVATATLETSGGTVVIHCAVAASASDINMSGGLTITAGATVACTGINYTALPA